MPTPIGDFTNQFPGYTEPMSRSAPTAATTNLVSNLLGILTIISGVSFLIYFMLGAVNWITSGGDTNKAAAARIIILNAVFGLAITVVAYPAALILSGLLGFPLANPAELFNNLF